MSDAQDSWLSKLGIDIDKHRQEQKAQAAQNEKTVDDAVGGAINYVMGGAEKLVDSAPIPDALKDVAKTGIQVEKGIYEGVYTGVKGLVGAAETAGNVVSGKALLDAGTELAEAAVSDDARKDLVKDVTADYNKAKFIAESAVNPIGTMVNLGGQVVTGYQEAEKKGQTAEFIGKGIGLAGVVAATAAVGGEGELADLATAGEEGGGAAEGLLEKPPLPEEPPPEIEPEPPAQNARPDPRVDPEPPPDTIEEPPVGPQPPREPPPDTIRDPPAFPKPPREAVPEANFESPDGPATEPRLAPGQEPLPGPATEPAPRIEPDPPTQPRPAPGEDIPSGPATERAPQRNPTASADEEGPPDTDRSPTFPNDPPNPYENQPDVKIEPPPDTDRTPTFPNDPPNPYEEQPPVRIEDPEAPPPPSTERPAPDTERTPELEQEEGA